MRNELRRAEYPFTHYSGSGSSSCEACIPFPGIPVPNPTEIHLSGWDNSVLVGVSLWF
ncbi:MAG TPA: hypothetical protein VMT70_06265 [Vicinamibacteria bacterium]|nr:hypothetical protein [Vicinamibacteria bacterium]